MKSKKKVKCHINNKRYLYLGLMLFILTLVLVEPTYCQVTHDQIKAATKTFVEIMNDWMPAIIAGGLFGSGICLFANNYRMGISGLAGTGFLYAAKSFVGDGQAAVLAIADQILQIM
ncbi:MAG: hypothetical protein J5821_03830 [Alphaproteobacteria bacterium]|nr:hypothetical protein [Alphaproteobacteria bacterium]